MRICVVGAGAIGGLLAAKLQQSGEQVSVIARGPHLAAIKANGLKLIEEDGSEIVARVAATDRIAEAGEQDLVILGMKAHQVAAVVADLTRSMMPDTMVLTAQNGIPWWYFFKHGGAVRRPPARKRRSGRRRRRQPADRARARLGRLSGRRDHPARRHQAHRGQPLLALGDRQHRDAAHQAGLGDAARTPASRRRSSPTSARRSGRSCGAT